jgi:hypothetical protein
VRKTGRLDGVFKLKNLSGAGVGALRVALLFGSAAVALSLVFMQDGDRRSSRQAILNPGIDHIVTSSFNTKNNTLQQKRSVFQASPDECVISRDGTKRGNC